MKCFLNDKRLVLKIKKVKGCLSRTYVIRFPMK